MHIVILGPQGSGKSTMADLLAKKFRVPHIDGGQLLRTEIAQGTVIGRRIAEPMRKGELIPSEIVNEVMRQRLSKTDCAKGYVFDGYPREIPEAEFLDGIAPPDAVIVLKIPDVLAVKRLAARRVCQGCTAPLYGMLKDIRKACGSCGGKLVQREDDKPAIVRRRLKIYHKATEPVIAYYKERGIAHSVDAKGGVKTVFTRILKTLAK